MATVRSISVPKPPERLLKRRPTRTSTSSNTPQTARKVTINKTTAVTVATINRRKSTRMSSKKHSNRLTTSPNAIHSSTLTLDDPQADLTERMATTTITELPLIRPLSKISTDVDPRTIRSSFVSIPSELVQQDKSIEESPTNEHPSSDNEERGPSPAEPRTPSASSRKSSAETIPFTIESLDVVRTVGTGKKNGFHCFLFISPNQWKSNAGTLSRL